MIGRFYKPYDNNYCINVKTKEPILLTNSLCDEDERDAKFVIVCEPYKEKIYFCGFITRIFVNIKSSKTQNIYRILFYDFCVL